MCEIFTNIGSSLIWEESEQKASSQLAVLQGMYCTCEEHVQYVPSTLMNDTNQKEETQLHTNVHIQGEKCKETSSGKLPKP